MAMWGCAASVTTIMREGGDGSPSPSTPQGVSLADLVPHKRAEYYKTAVPRE